MRCQNCWRYHLTPFYLTFSDHEHQPTPFILLRLLLVSDFRSLPSCSRFLDGILLLSDYIKWIRISSSWKTSGERNFSAAFNFLGVFGILFKSSRKLG